MNINMELISYLKILVFYTVFVLEHLETKRDDEFVDEYGKQIYFW